MEEKKMLYNDLKKRMTLNKKQIKFLKKLILALGVLFITISFVLFYSTSILLNSNTKFNIVFASLLCILFLSLVGIQVVKKQKEIEIRNIDTQIYELLRLRI